MRKSDRWAVFVFDGRGDPLVHLICEKEGEKEKRGREREREEREISRSFHNSGRNRRVGRRDEEEKSIYSWARSFLRIRTRLEHKSLLTTATARDSRCATGEISRTEELY